MVRRLADGTIEWLGRLDQQVKIRGFRIELEEIESALAAHQAIREAVVLAREDEPGDKRLVAYLTMKEGETSKDSELRELLRARLPEYMVPSAFVILDRFPLTPNGKVDRKALPRPDAHQSNASEIALMLTETQKALSDIWRHALGLEGVGLHDNFFELGGHSLLAVRVIAEINKTLNMRVSVPQFFQNPTIDELAISLESEGRLSGKPRPRVLRLQPGQAGPVYFLQAGPAENRIARFMGRDRAVYATDVPLPMVWRRALTSANQAAWPTVEQLGSLHGEAIRAHAGTSPCVVAGYSFHGKVVIEAARALQRAGGHLATVFLIDSRVWTGRAHAMRETLRCIWRGDANAAADDATYVGGFYAPLRRSVNSLSWVAAQAPPMLKRGLARLAFPDSQQDATGWFDEEGAPVTMADITQLFLSHRSRFNPPPLDAAAVLFRVRRPGDEMLPRDGFDNGWGGRFARGLEIIEVRGDHWSLVKDERDCAALARQINVVLDSIAAAPETPGCTELARSVPRGRGSRHDEVHRVGGFGVEHTE